MAEYIEKNVAIARLTALEIGNPCATMTDAKRQIADTRPADVAPVMRCMDCKHAYINSFAVSSGEALCTLSGKPMQQDDFCSYGEPKEV